MLVEKANPVAAPPPSFTADEGMLSLLASPLTDEEPSSTSELNAEYIRLHSFDADAFSALAADDGRFHLTVVGRSGFDNISSSLQFEDEVATELAHTMEGVAAYGLAESLTLWTSSTDGIVDRVIKSMTDWGMECRAVHCPSLEVYVNPEEEHPLPTFVTTDEKYSLATLAMRNGALLCFPGGPWALYNDVAAAIALGRDIVLADMKKYDEFTEDGRINNHVRHLIKEMERFKDMTADEREAALANNPDDYKLTVNLFKQAEKLRTLLSSDPLFANCRSLADSAPQKAGDIWQLFHVIEEDGRGLKMAQFIAARTPTTIESKDTDSVMGVISAATPVCDISIRVNAAKIRLAVAGIGFRGSEQMTLDAPAKRLLEDALKQAQKTLHLKPRDIALICGVQLGGIDNITTELGHKGFPTMKIASQKELDALVTRKRSPQTPTLVVPEHNLWDKARVQLGIDQTFGKAQAVILFEGDEGCLPLLKEAADRGIPCWVVKLGDRSLSGKSFDHTTFKVTVDSIASVSSYVSAKKRAGLFKKVSEKIIALNKELVIEKFFVPAFNPSLIALFLSKCQGLLNKSKQQLASLAESDPKRKKVLELIDLIERLSFLIDEDTTIEKNGNIKIVTSAAELGELISSLDHQP